ncbi:MAG TPA: topoisomerase C-terminal repeat-containing protein, partial [Candidatus Saccharimonadales bacterium]|nr:topoisomerase C-terminal repeat-containing protein [Candidatus Saccharimonadales bacterium]
ELKVFTLKDDSVQSGTTTENTGVERKKLIPTHLAEMTTDFLTKHFTSILDYKFTAHVEEDFDKIAAGDIVWNNMISDFYKDFEPLVKKSENVSRQETSQARELGNDPKTGKPILARFGRYGPMLQKGRTEDTEKPVFAPLPEGSTLNTVTFEQALEMFNLPRSVGTTAEGEEIIANIGRFGPYIKVGSTFVSIKPHDPFSIDEATARTLYEAKKKGDADKFIKKFSKGLSIVKGPYGPYITNGKKNARIPKGLKPEDIDEEAAKSILEAAPASKRRRRAK